MKFTIKDRQSDAPVKLDLAKHPRNKSISILMDDDRSKVLELSSNKGKLTVAIDVSKGISVTDLDSSSAIGMDDTPLPAANLDDLRNWERESDRINVFHPRTGHKIELEIHQPGTKTPQREERDILGQPEMTFAVAYAIARGRHSLLIGPTGTGKTSIYRWFAKNLGMNLILAPIARGTEAAHLVGDYMPTGQALFEWMNGPVTEAVELSDSHPTMLVFDELNRIGNIAEFARIYSVLDDTRMLELPELRDEGGVARRLEVGNLTIGATANPSDDEAADYVGVQDLDPALSSRFAIQPTVGYPPVEVEVEALIERVPDIDKGKAQKMVLTAKRIRESADVRFPMSFRELEAWASLEPAFGYQDAARVAVINKAPRLFHQALENILKAM